MNINKRTRLCSESARLINEPKKIIQVLLLNEPKKIIQVRLFSLTNEHKQIIIELVHEQFIEHSVRLHS